MRKFVILLLAVLAVVSCDSGENRYSETVRHLQTALDRDPQAKALVEKSIAAAARLNPDRVTNPAQTLDQFYEYADWTLTRMPWSFFPDSLFHGFAEKTDQSILYPYWLLDQPLGEITDETLFYNSVEYMSPVREWLVEYCRKWGEFLSTPESWNDTYYEMIASEEKFGLRNGWYEDKSSWHSFNDFFSRRTVDGARPIAEADNDAVVCAPADALPQGVWEISDDGRFEADAISSEEGVQLKSRMFVSIEQLLGPEGASFASCFHGGRLTHTYLNYDDYHRYHFPVSGTVRAAYIIDHDDAVGGIVYWSDTLKRYVLESNSLSWQAYETRGCVIVETPQFGLVAVLPIGMGQVSSVNWEDDVKVGQQFRKGDPLGYFLFGGSDCVVVFQREANFVLTCPHGGEGSYSHGYAHLYQGNELGRVTLSASSR